MIPQKGQYVKIVFRNSTQLEGLVEEWTSTKSLLKSQDGQSYCVIMKTDEDVMAVKIILNVPATINDLQKSFENVQEEFQQTVDGPSDDEIRLSNLAKLRQLMAEQDNKIVRDKLKNHTITDVRKQQYGLPNFLTKPRA